MGIYIVKLSMSSRLKLGPSMKDFDEFSGQELPIHQIAPSIPID